MLPALLEGLVPVVLSFVQQLLSKNGVASDPVVSRQWTMGLLKEVASQLDKYLPSWIKPEEAALEALLDDAIGRALDAVEKK
jgi:hypothetical protein